MAAGKTVSGSTTTRCDGACGPIPPLAHFRPARRRGNVCVEVSAHAERIVFHSGRAVGIAFRDAGGTLRQARAQREVVLCAGAINTPKLLMLSGIGPQAHLLTHGIDVIAPREEVGKNLQDHLAVRIICKTRKPITVNDDLRSLWRLARMGAKFLLQRTGPFGLRFRAGRDVLQVAEWAAARGCAGIPDALQRAWHRAAAARFLRIHGFRDAVLAQQSRRRRIAGC
ncbi:GMC family oxidoreductase N-terminal domain-containing protein [Cupriavidus basilensis]